MTPARGTSPLNPSIRATARVTNPMPAPSECLHCAAPVELVSNERIYGCEYGEWPWVFLCTGCGAYVGLHPFTAIPLGTLATAEIRDARKLAKAAFNPLWQQGGMSRKDAYAWLAGALRMDDVNTCHIGWFDVAQCNAVVSAINRENEAYENNA